MASPQNRRSARQREEFDIDALFASEEEGEAPPPRQSDAPTLIFTQPADRNVQQFPDEAIQFAEEPDSLAEQPPSLAEEADPLAIPLLPSPEHPYRGRWNQVELPKRKRRGRVLGAAAFVGAIALAATLAVPPQGADEDTALSESSSTPAAVPPLVVGNAAPPSSETPPAPQPPQDPPSEASAAPPETPSSRPPESQAAVTRLDPPRAPVRGTRERDGRETARPAATSGRVASTKPPVATRGVSSEPPAPPALAVPTVTDARRAGTDAAAPVLGQPLGPPRELPEAPVLRDSPPGPRVEPSAPAAAPSAPPPTTAVNARAVETDRVRAVLSGYERAYSALDADAASRVFPAVDRKALSRAFSTLSAQQIQFNDCRIEVQQASARATCAGTARWTPKVGGGAQQQARRWQFDLEQASGGWRIGSVRVQ